MEIFPFLEISFYGNFVKRKNKGNIILKGYSLLFLNLKIVFITIGFFPNLTCDPKCTSVQMDHWL